MSQSTGRPTRAFLVFDREGEERSGEDYLRLESERLLRETRQKFGFHRFDPPQDYAALELDGEPSGPESLYDSMGHKLFGSAWNGNEKTED